jgi:hypothetical protein
MLLTSTNANLWNWQVIREACTVKKSPGPSACIAYCIVSGHLYRSPICIDYRKMKTFVWSILREVVVVVVVAYMLCNTTLPTIGTTSL